MGRYRHLEIGWFGAEPLAGIGVIRSLTPALADLAGEFHCDYSARIVTNGVALGVDLARELVESLHVHEAEITLDGLQPIHDARRQTKTGKGSFQQIFRNIREVGFATTLRLVVRCNVDRSNVDGVAPLIEALAAAGLAGRISFYVSPVYSWGNDAHVAALEKEEYATLEIEWLALQLRLGFKVGLVPPRRKIVCMSVQPHAEVLDAYGNTFNCTEVPYVPAYGEPNLYAIRVSSMRSSERMVGGKAPLRLRDFNMQLLNQEHTTCASCRMLPVCGGQCPKAWHEGHPPCPAAKVNMPQRLNLLFALAQAPERPT
jgi:uncharacterized protein